MSSDFAYQQRKSELFGWYVYVAEEDGAFFSKVGTASNPAYRLDGLKGGNPRPLKILCTWHVHSREIAFAIEADALLAADVFRVRGRDWVRCPGADLVAIVRECVRKQGVNAAENIA